MKAVAGVSRTSAKQAASNGNLNGIDVAALQEMIDGIKAAPMRAATFWSVHSRWAGGTRANHHVRGFEMGGQEIARSFEMKSDEPVELGGTNLHPNPQEYLLAALNACMMVGYSAVAALMGIELTKLEVETTGEIDLRGFLGISDRIPAGYPQIDQTVRLAGSGTADQFARLHEIVRATSPNFFNITNAIPVNSRVVLE